MPPLTKKSHDMKNIILLLLISIIFLQCEKDASSSSFASPNGVSPTGQGGSLARFAIVGNYLYTVDHQKLSVYDIADAGNPLIKKTIDIGFDIETIFPFKDKLFIGSASVVHIFSIADPVNPQKLSEAISPQVLRRCDPVVAKDTVAFATLRTNGPCGGRQSILAVFDIKDITRPVQKGAYLLTEPYGLGYQDDVLYVCDKPGLLVLDISKPYAPVYIKAYNDGPYIDVIPYMGSLICWVDKGVVVYDITNNKNPVLLARIN